MINEVTAYINHRYKDEMIIPYGAMLGALSFLKHEGKKRIITSDDVKCNVVECREVHLCETEDKVKELYNMDCWSFIKRWYSTINKIDSLFCVYLKVEKE